MDVECQHPSRWKTRTVRAKRRKPRGLPGTPEVCPNWRPTIASAGLTPRRLLCAKTGDGRMRGGTPTNKNDKASSRQFQLPQSGNPAGNGGSDHAFHCEKVLTPSWLEPGGVRRASRGKWSLSLMHIENRKSFSVVSCGVGTVIS